MKLRSSKQLNTLFILRPPAGHISGHFSRANKFKRNYASFYYLWLVSYWLFNIGKLFYQAVII
jgi:hypothetical protein